MDKLWSKTEISHLKRYAEQQSLEELAQRFHTDTETVRRKMAELGIVGGEAAADETDASILLLNDALKALYAHQWKEADTLLAKVIESADHQHLAERARQYRTVCAHRLAAARALEDPFLEAVYQKNNGKLDAALALVQQHGKSDDEAWLFLHASLLALLGQADEALSLLGRSIELNPKNRVHAYHDPDLQSLRGRESWNTLLRLRA